MHVCRVSEHHPLCIWTECRRICVLSILQRPLILLVGLLLLEEIVEHLLVPDGVLTPFLILCALDLTQISDPPNLGICLVEPFFCDLAVD